MRRISFSIAYWFFIVCGIFVLYSNLSFALELETDEATDITSNSATLHGTIISDGRAPVLWFDYGTTSGSYTHSEPVQDWFPGKTKVSAGISGLTAVTTYYYRIAGYDTIPGTPLPLAYGSEKSFTTLSATPTATPTPQGVITREATNITSNSATLNATVYFGAIQSMLFEYGTASGLYTNSVGAVREDTSERVSADISGLSPSTTYYDRIVVVTKPVPTISTGYTYGNEESFTTLAATPTGTPTPVCEAEFIGAFPKTLKLKREESGDVTVTVTGSEGCPVIGETVTAKIQSGKKRISISPLSADTDVNGQAIFTIAATKKTGNAKVKFVTASGLKTTVTVKVRKD